MKLKKFAAAALTAVMSLAMLTACGGGGNGSAAAGTGWTRQEVIVEDSDGEVPEAERITSYYTSDGKWLYEKYTDSTGREEYLSKVDGSESYAVNTASNPWMAYKDGGSGAAIEVVNTSTEESFEEYKATKYKTITITETLADGTKRITTEYYDVTNGTLEYIKTGWTSKSGNSHYEIARVEINKAEVDRVNVDKLNIDNYKKVDYDEFNGIDK